MKQSSFQSLFAVLAAVVALPALAADSAPAEVSAAAPAEEAAPAAAPALPLPHPGRVLMPGGPRFDALPEEEKEHVRHMAEFKAVRDEAEQTLLRIDEDARARKEKILEENEEAKKLHDRILELKAEFDAATNALETIYRDDPELQALEEKVEQARKIVHDSQAALNQEVVASMKKRMERQRAALAAEKAGATEVPELAPEAFSNLVERTRGFASPRVAPGTPNPDIKPPLTPRRAAPPPPSSSPAPAPAK